MISQPGEETTEQLYLEYREAAIAVRRASQKVVFPLLALGLVVMCGGVCALLWAGYRTGATLAFWGVVLGTGIGLVAAIVGVKRQKEAVAAVAKAKPGFAEFFASYNSLGGWAKSMPTGQNLDRFLDLVGRSG
jgi:hypothetical protein